MIKDEWFTNRALNKFKEDYGIMLLMELFNHKLTIYDLTRDQFLFIVRSRDLFPLSVSCEILAILKGDLLLNCDKGN